MWFSAVKRLSQYPTYSVCPLTARFKGILSQSIQCLFGFGSLIYHQLIPSLVMSKLDEAHPSPVHCVGTMTVWKKQTELFMWFELFEPLKPYIFGQQLVSALKKEGGGEIHRLYSLLNSHKITECSPHISCTISQVFWIHMIFYVRNKANIFLIYLTLKWTINCCNGIIVFKNWISPFMNESSDHYSELN